MCPLFQGRAKVLQKEAEAERWDKPLTRTMTAEAFLAEAKQQGGLITTVKALVAGSYQEDHDFYDDLLEGMGCMHVFMDEELAKETTAWDHTVFSRLFRIFGQRSDYDDGHDSGGKDAGAPPKTSLKGHGDDIPTVFTDDDDEDSWEDEDEDDFLPFPSLSVIPSVNAGGVVAETATGAGKETLTDTTPMAL